MYLRKFFLLLLASTLILVGLLGMILPIVHGTVFLLIGLIIFSFESAYIEKKVLYFVTKNKLIHDLYSRMDITLRKIFKK